MEIRRYAEILKRHQWVVLITTLVAIAMVAFGTYRMTPVYSASAMVRLTELRDTPIGFSDLNYTERLQNTYVQLAESRPFLLGTIQVLNLQLQPEQLARMVKVEAVQNTELIKVTATSPNPVESAGISNVLATLMLTQKQPSHSVTVVEGAAIPTTPSGPNKPLYLALGALVGLLGGIGLAFLFENLDGAIHFMDELEGAAGVPLLAWIPSFRTRRGGGQVAVLDGTEGSFATEAFRILSTNTLSLGAHTRDRGQSPMKSLLITSAEPGAGKSTVLVNLAAAVARKGSQVVVVDSDLRHSSLHIALGLPNELGLRDVIANPSRLGAALQTTDIPGVRLLSSGSLGAPELLSSPNMKSVIQELTERADIVLLDSPPVLASADAAVLAGVADATIIVAARDQATGRNIELAMKQLERVGSWVMGIVFNRAKEAPVDLLHHYQESSGNKNGNGRQPLGSATSS